MKMPAALRVLWPRALLRHQNELQDHIAGTYFGLRAGLALVGLALPVALVVGGLVAGPEPGVRPSLSDYYHGPMRDLFVGALIAIAAMLTVYKGFSDAEDRILDLAGLFAVGVAAIPTPAILHYACALGFFGCVGLVCGWRASDTLSLIDDPAERRRYERSYRIIAVLLVALPVLVAVVGALASLPVVILVAEWAAIWVFGSYWVVKSTELARTHAELKASAGELVVQEAEGTPVRRVLARRKVVEVDGERRPGLAAKHRTRPA